MDIANNSLPSWHAASKDLVQNVLERFQQFPTFGLKQLCIPAIQVKHATIWSLFGINLKGQSRLIQNCL
jgi:hypothetical protein